MEACFKTRKTKLVTGTLPQQVALTEAKDHVMEMNDGKEVNIYF